MSEEKKPLSFYKQALAGIDATVKPHHEGGYFSLMGDLSQWAKDEETAWQSLYRAAVERGYIRDTEHMSLHWLTVGYVSPQAKQWIEECGGSVKQVNEEPALYAVALAYDPAGKWVWSKGRQQLRAGIEFWTTGEIQEASTGINLLYKSMDSYTSAEYYSAHEVYLILPDEEYDPATGKVKEPGQYKIEPLKVDESHDPDEHPF